MKTIIIGAGPAGLNAAIHAAGNQNKVILLEKNEKAGRKLYITGKGRCNVTNNCTKQEFIDHIVHNPRFLYAAVNAFSPQDTIAFFNEHHTPLVTERGKRVFPQSYHASDITDALVRECQHRGVQFHFQTEVNKIQKKDDQFIVQTNRGIFTSDTLVIATGGLSYPSTGSTGDGYRFASSFGHTIIDTAPALTGIKIKEKIPHALNGFLLKNVSFSVIDGKFRHTGFGEMSFYPGYLDGPVVISASSLINKRNNQNLKIEIDLKPALDDHTLSQRIERDIVKRPNDTMEEILHGLLPSPFVSFFMENTDIDFQTTGNQFTHVERMKLVHALKHFALTYNGLNGYQRAVVTAGGISTKEINPSTMESKIVPGLFFAGEVIDVDAYTGGFNIQTALSTGALAGDIIRKLSETKQ